jgi:ABC-type amino acid transport substrate-binding protein
MRARILPTILIVLSIFAAAVAQAGDSVVPRILERGTLIVGTSGNMPTMSFIDDQGRPAGFDMDLARIMADVMETGLEIRVMPFTELLPALRRGEMVAPNR